MEAKQTVRALLDRLPDDCSLDELLYHLYVLTEVEKGRADVDAGRTVSHAEVAAELRNKWRHGAEKCLRDKCYEQERRPGDARRSMLSFRTGDARR